MGASAAVGEDSRETTTEGGGVRESIGHDGLRPSGDSTANKPQGHGAIVQRPDVERI